MVKVRKGGRMSKPKQTAWAKRQMAKNRECRAAARALTKAKFYNHHIVLMEIARAQGANSVHLLFLYRGKDPSSMSVGVFPTKKAKREYEAALRRQGKGGP